VHQLDQRPTGNLAGNPWQNSPQRGESFHLAHAFALC
jgi:hypothetical protein